MILASGRKFLLLQQEHPPSPFGQEPGDCGAGGSSADDDDVVVIAHWLTSLQELDKKVGTGSQSPDSMVYLIPTTIEWGPTRCST
jgi:hypothetical protein